RLLPAPGDGEAAYTYRVYEFDDPRKVERRRARRELLSDRLRLLMRLESESAELLGLADRLRRYDFRGVGQILQQLKSIRADARRALGDLKRYAGIPADAPQACRCPVPGNDSLPEELGRQMVEIPDCL